MIMVQRLLKKYGSTYTLRKISSDGLIDPDHPSKGTNETYTDYQITAFADNNIFSQDGLIHENYTVLYTQTNVQISRSDKIILNNEVWNIVAVTPQTISNEIVYYEVHIRQ